MPEHVVPNDTFVTMGLDTSDEWIASRTGIERRRVVEPDEATSDMATRAAKQAMAVAGLNAGDIDLIIVATCTPDHVMPATASLVWDGVLEVCQQSPAARRRSNRMELMATERSR